MKIWQRYFLAEMAKVFLFILFAAYLLFVIIDYSLHTKIFAAVHLPWTTLLAYYGYQFFAHAELLVPFALLLATIKLFTTLNLHNELVPLLAGGVKMRKLVGPPLLLGCLAATLLWANYEYLYPQAMERLGAIETLTTKGTVKGALHVVRLKDGSKVLYQGFDASKQAFNDVFWLRNSDELYHMRELYPLHKAPVGRYVDRLVRDASGAFEKEESYAEHAFEKMRFDKRDLFAALVPPPQMSLTTLFEQRPRHKGALSDREAQVVTALNLKLAYPLACLLVIIAPAPWCLRFRRNLSVFFIYCVSIAGFLALLTTMDAVTILGDNHVFSPTWIIWTPLLSLGAIFAGRLRLGLR